MKSFDNYAKGTAMVEVNSANTAIAASSGSLEVFGTPFMIALMEKATTNAVVNLLDDGETTVGTKIDVSHCKASGLGTVITAEAELVEVSGRRLVFGVKAFDDKGDVIGQGVIERFVVIAEKFMSRLS